MTFLEAYVCFTQLLFFVSFGAKHQVFTQSRKHVTRSNLQQGALQLDTQKYPQKTYFFQNLYNLNIDNLQ